MMSCLFLSTAVSAKRPCLTGDLWRNASYTTVVHEKILHPTSSLTASKPITSPPNTSNGLIPLNNTETSRSNPARNKLCAGLPCFFTLTDRRLSSAPPARQAAQSQHGHQPVYLRRCGHMCVFQIEPFAFLAAKQRLYLPTPAVCFNPLALFVTANHQQLPVGQTGSLKIVLLPIQHHRPNLFPSPAEQTG